MAKKVKDMNWEEASKYYERKIERGEVVKNKDFLYSELETVYKLGKGNWERGYELYYKLQKQRMDEAQEKPLREFQTKIEKLLKDNPLAARISKLQKSEDPLDRALYKYIRANAYTDLPVEEAQELERKLIKEETKMPEPGSPASAWLDYAKNYKEKTGKRKTDKELAEQSGLNVGTFRVTRHRRKHK